MRPHLFFPFAALVLLLLVALDLCLGTVRIAPNEVWRILTDASYMPPQAYWRTIVWDIRLPHTLAALLAGSALSVSGLLMQTMFRNPIAGPFVLGVTGGSSLGVALFVFGASVFSLHLGVGKVAASFGGSLAILLVILLVSRRVHGVGTLLIIGIMIGSTTEAFITILQYFSQQELLKRYLLWNLGSLNGVNLYDLVYIVLPVVLVGLSLAFLLSKSLDALLFNDIFAQSIGISVRRVQQYVVFVTALLTSIVTAYCGPISFIGIAVPHMVRLTIHAQQHRHIIPSVALSGSILLLACDILSQIPYSPAQLPINAITSLLGGPFVVWILLRNPASNKITTT